MDTVITKEFRNALRNFLHSPAMYGKFSNADRARDFIERAEPALAHRFLLDQTEHLIRLEERAERNAAFLPSEQLRFLGDDFSSLFNSPQQLLPLKTGRRKLLDMTVSQLRQAAVAIRARVSRKANAQAAYLEKLADEMSPYAQQHRQLTFADYLELRAAGIEAAQPAARV
jgi:hypothetical protein